LFLFLSHGFHRDQYSNYYEYINILLAKKQQIN